ncbi:arginine kinase-like isoform X2 [Palaemon carinicauda]|uniref:arginine kinase-like isoform X2 n=1 Tax=Palaemon carinicauda TaxID=392227 RepID=UPI0035B5774B
MARDKEGAVALHYAAKSGDPKVTQIHHVRCIPAAVTVEDNEGRTPLHYAGMAKGTGADEVFSLLEKEGASADAADMESIEELHKAVEEGETRKVVQLLDKRKKAQTRDRNQANILHKAVLHGHTDLVRYMVSSFPELMKQEDRAGRTPLHYAAVIRDGGHIYKILEKEGADSKAKDQSGHSPEDYKNDPKILTQWDLKNELEEGIGHDGGGGRPLTKGSEAPGGEDGSELTDADASFSLDEEYEKFSSTDSSSLLKKYLTQEIFDSIKDRTTSLGANLHDCIKSGLANPDSHIGLYAPDAESYACFKELFDPIIDEYHGGFGPDDTHPEVNFGDPSALGDLNEWGDYVVSTRVRSARSVEGYPFNPILTNDQYIELEQNIDGALQTLEDDLAGNFRSLSDISPEEQEELLEKHLLFKQGDRFLEAAGACRFWPDGRGIFLNADNTLVIWVNEEDHLRIISMQEGGNLSEVYSRFVRAVTALGDQLPFSSSEHLGFLSFCPTNLGTGIRASVHIRLPKLGEDTQTLEETANKYNLQVRGTSGEHSEATDYVFDISNRRRLGITEIEALQEMYDGVKEIIQLEKSMEDGNDESSPGGEDGNELTDADASFSLDEEYEKFSSTDSSSLLKKYLTQEIFDSIKDRTTSLGATLHDCIKSGLANPDSHIGLYAPDAESYACFKELFDPVIDEYHGGFGSDDTHPEVNFGDPSALGDLNEWGDYVVSTRVRCARSVEGYPFNPILTNDQYIELEQNIDGALQTLEDDLAGNFRSLSDISPEEQEELLEKHLLFKQGDRFLEAAGACRFWPDGRGIFLNADNSLVIWVNEEDHLRIISMQEGGNLSEVYSRFVRAVTALGDKLPFSSSEHLGFLSFCPTNLGTGIRASVHIRLPKLGEDIQTLEETASKYNLQVRGTSGEHSEAKDYVFDISNRRRLGITEIEALQEMYDGVKEIIQLEKSMEDSGEEHSKSSNY